MRSGRGRGIGLSTQGATPRGGINNDLVGAQFELAVGTWLGQPLGGVYGYEQIRRDFQLPDGRPVWVKATYPEYLYLIVQPRDEPHLQPNIVIIAGRKVNDVEVEFFGWITGEEFMARSTRRTLGTLSNGTTMKGSDLYPMWVLAHDQNIPHPGLWRTNPELYPEMSESLV